MNKKDDVVIPLDVERSMPEEKSKNAEYEDSDVSEYENPEHHENEVDLSERCNFCTNPMKEATMNLDSNELIWGILILLMSPIITHFTVFGSSNFVVPIPSAIYRTKASYKFHYSLGFILSSILLLPKGLIALMKAMKRISAYFSRKSDADGINDPRINDVSNHPPITESGTQNLGAQDKQHSLRPPIGNSKGSRVHKWKTDDAVVRDRDSAPGCIAWLKRATRAEIFLHLLLPMRWLVVAVIIFLFPLYNFIASLVDHGEIAASSYYIRASYFISGIAHPVVFLFWGKLVCNLVRLCITSTKSYMRCHYLGECETLPNGKELLHDVKYAFMMDKCPCKYLIKEHDIVSVAYTWSVYYHCLFTGIYKSVLVFSCVVTGIFLFAVICMERHPQVITPGEIKSAIPISPIRIENIIPR